MPQRIVKKKVNLLGDPGVGKTSLILRFVKDIFGDEYLKTIGTTVYSKDIPVIGTDVKLMIYDIMGENDYDYLQETCFRQSSGAIAVADATRMDTLDSLIDNWLPKYKVVANKKPSLILAINKVDLEDHREIERDFVVKEVSSYFDYVFFTSAKTGKDVEHAFTELASRALFRTKSTGRDVEDIISDKYLNTPHHLMGALLAYVSELGDVAYEDREKLLSDSGIDKFKMNTQISEDSVLRFADNVISWYEKNGDENSSQAVKQLIERYK
ncbi:MAG: Rab family GTPase [Thermoplasmatota archaeon]